MEVTVNITNKLEITLDPLFYKGRSKLDSVCCYRQYRHSTVIGSLVPTTMAKYMEIYREHYNNT